MRRSRQKAAVPPISAIVFSISVPAFSQRPESSGIGGLNSPACFIAPGIRATAGSQRSLLTSRICGRRELHSRIFSRRSSPMARNAAKCARERSPTCPQLSAIPLYSTITGCQVVCKGYVASSLLGLPNALGSAVKMNDAPADGRRLVANGRSAESSACESILGVLRQSRWPPRYEATKLSLALSRYQLRVV